MKMARYNPIISIVIPVFHEEKTIIELLRQITDKVKNSYEVFIIYDQTNDPTVSVVKKYLISSKSKNILLAKNSTGNGRGVTNAIKTGFFKARGKAVVAVMADLSDDLSDIDKMYKKISQGYDIICGSRYMKGGKKIGGPMLKTFLSKTAGLTLHYLFKLPTHDATNAFKMYRKTLLEKIQIESTGGFEYSLEITLKAFKKGYKIGEIPTVWYDRPAGKSNFKLLRWLPKYLKAYSIVLPLSRFGYWRTQASKNISIPEHMIFMSFALITSSLIYSFILMIFNFKFKIPATSAINWLTEYNYPKQQDYYFLYTFLMFNFIVSLIFWSIWTLLKLKKR